MIPLFFLNLFHGQVMAKCGHMTRIWDICRGGGEERVVKMIPQKGVVEYCHECLGKMTIRCAWCGKSIFPNEPVTLYTPGKRDFKIPGHAVIFNENPLQLVGCLRVNCADTGADRMGFWVPPGQVLRVLSPIEMLLQAGGDKVLIIPDLQDLDSARIIPR